jgi:23S rRNA pseudouridine955/2504/2580 synthase/23S rRNA pseudouridine1911/1915/1917 synthase
MTFSFNIKTHILLEDPYILVVDKPAGLMVEPDRNGNPSLLQFVKEYLKSNSLNDDEIYAQHIHRLDRPVTGVVLFAKQKSVLRNLSEQFAERKVKKQYRALTLNVPPEWNGRLEHWHRKEKKKAAIYLEEIQYSEKAILDYQIQRYQNNHYLWEIELHTGKFHQIRAQLAFMGCPIIGDAMYGSGVEFQKNTIALQASKLIFHHPITDQELILESKSLF